MDASENRNDRPMLTIDVPEFDPKIKRRYSTVRGHFDTSNLPSKTHQKSAPPKPLPVLSSPLPSPMPSPQASITAPPPSPTVQFLFQPKPTNSAFNFEVQAKLEEEGKKNEGHQTEAEVTDRTDELAPASFSPKLRKKQGV